jgi:23S rRNA (cytosine1962-C5)-methyltransferase
VRILNEAAHDAGRLLQIIEHRTQGPDHPVMASCVETKYLKCLICRVL